MKDGKRTMQETLDGLKDQIGAWKGEHGRLFLVKLTGLEQPAKIRDIPFIVRKPARAELARMVRDGSKDPLGSVQNLMLDITLHPDRTKLAALFEELPALAIGLQDSLKDVVGIGLDFSAQEL